MPIANGKILLDKYKILRLVGSGAWGDVHLAEDTELDRQVAIKHLKGELAKDKVALERFLREARIIAAFRNPNIVIIYALEKEKDDHYIVMEYAEKGSLEDLFKEATGGLSIRESIDIAIAICQGLETAHDKRIVHRDVKPSNILLCSDAKGNIIPKLSDFGVAHMPTTDDGKVSPLTSKGELIGTVRYMSPEQAKGDEIDGRSDLYSVGAVLYEMLTGEPPFTGSTWDIIQGHIEKKPKPPSQIRSSISGSLNELVIQALSKEPSQRHQSARQMVEALQRVKPKEVGKRETSERLYSRAVDYLERSRWEEAIEVLNEILRVAPAYKDAADKLEDAKRGKKAKKLYEEGIDHLKMEAWQQAIEKFKEVISLDVEYLDTVQKLEEARVQEGLEILYMRGAGYERRGAWQKAIEMFEGILAEDSRYRDAADRLNEAKKQENLKRLYEQGMQHFRAQQWQSAIERFKEITTIDRSYRDTVARLDEAKKQLRLETLYNRGLDYFKAEEWERAIRAFDQVTSLDKEYKDASVKKQEAKKQKQLSTWYAQALKLEKIEEWEDAYNLFHEILSTDPAYREDIPSRLARADKRRKLPKLYEQADAYLTDDQWEKAADTFTEIVDIDSRYKDAKVKLKMARKKLRRLISAYNRGISCLQKERWEEAVESFKQVLALDPKYMDAAARLREAEQKMSDSNKFTDQQPEAGSASQGWRVPVTSVLGAIVIALATMVINKFLGPLRPWEQIVVILALLFILVPLLVLINLR
jgi:serine/threonine protein kinase